MNDRIIITNLEDPDLWPVRLPLWITPQIPEADWMSLVITWDDRLPTLANVSTWDLYPDKPMPITHPHWFFGFNWTWNDPYFAQLPTESAESVVRRHGIHAAIMMTIQRTATDQLMYVTRLNFSYARSASVQYEKKCIIRLAYWRTQREWFAFFASSPLFCPHRPPHSSVRPDASSHPLLHKVRMPVQVLLDLPSPAASRDAICDVMTREGVNATLGKEAIDENGEVALHDEE